MHNGIDGKLRLCRIDTLGFLTEKMTPRPLELEVRQLVQLAIFVALVRHALEQLFELSKGHGAGP